jgi:hypothetical protein
MQLSERGIPGIQISNFHLYLDLCCIHYVDQKIGSRRLYTTVRQPHIEHVELKLLLHCCNILYIVQVWLKKSLLYCYNVI